MKRIKMREARQPDEGLEKPAGWEVNREVFIGTDAELTFVSPDEMVWIETNADGEEIARSVGRPRLDDAAVVTLADVAANGIGDTPVRQQIIDAMVANLRAPNMFDEISRAFGNVGRAASGIVRAGGYHTGGLVGNPMTPDGEIPVILDNPRRTSEDTLRRQRALRDSIMGTNPDHRRIGVNRDMFANMRINIDPAMGRDMMVVSTPVHGRTVGRSSVDDSVDALVAATLAISNPPHATVADETERMHREARNAVVERLHQEYIDLVPRALEREGYDDDLAPFDLNRLRGGRENLMLFERIVDQHDHLGVLSDLSFWGTGRKRIGIFRISEGAEQMMIGFNVMDQRRTMAHRYGPGPLSPNLWQTWALGELVIWGQLGSR